MSYSAVRVALLCAPLLLRHWKVILCCCESTFLIIDELTTVSHIRWLSRRFLRYIITCLSLKRFFELLMHVYTRLKNLWHLQNLWQPTHARTYDQKRAIYDVRPTGDACHCVNFTAVWFLKNPFSGLLKFKEKTKKSCDQLCSKLREFSDPKSSLINRSCVQEQQTVWRN